MTTSKPRPAVFLDRDGTLVHEDGWVTRPEQLRLIAGATDALRALARAGYALVLITNQSAVARGLVDEAGLELVHARLRSLLRADGVELDAIYHCPHHPEGAVEEHARDCGCRKPRPGMVMRARDELGLDLTRSYVVGDDLRDLALSEVGPTPVLVRTGKGAAREAAARERFGDALAVLDSIADLRLPPT